MGFALTALWSSLNSIILPLVLLQYVDETQKNTYLGLLTFTGLLLAMIFQPLVGILSDRSRFRRGRRRPFVFVGTLLAIIFLPGIGLAGSVVLLLAVYCLLQISTNTAQGAFQAFIPELVPEEHRGRASGVKSIMELLGGLILVRLVAYFMDSYYLGDGERWLWVSLGAIGIALLGAMLFTVFTVKEPTVHLLSPPVKPLTVIKGLKINIRENRSFLLFLGSRVLMGIPGIMLQLFALYYIMDVIDVGEPVSVFGNLLVVVGISLLAVTYPAGRLSDHIGRKSVIILSGLVGAAGMIILFFAASYWQLMVSGVFLGVANGAFLSSSWALATDLVAKGEEARYMAITNMAVAGGSALARLTGPVIDFFNNITAGGGYAFMMGLGFLCFLGGAALVVKVKNPEKNR